VTDTGPQQVEEVGDDEAQVLIADPDDYHETQRLREIHDARQQVLKHINDLDIHEKTGDRVYTYDITRLGNLVAVYAMELRPLAEQAGLADSDIATLSEDDTHRTIFEYADGMGMNDTDPMSIRYSMQVYQRCNGLLAEIKPLVTEQEETEWEI
jgi:hypothetical protein